METKTLYTGPEAQAQPPKIFMWINSQDAFGFHVVALAEDGDFLAGHYCSNPGFAMGDIGFATTQKHEAYCMHYPNGFELVWLEPEDTEREEFMKAVRLNNEIHGKKEEAGEAQA